MESILTKINIALDGPAGSGKSSAAKMVAKKLNIHYLDTGAMYRAVGYDILKKGINPLNREAVESEMAVIDVTISFVDGQQHVFVGTEDVTTKIRTPEISKAASDVSAHPSVRYKMADLQRETAQNYALILDGRDIGTFVLPDAKYKFFLTAKSEERAKRRLKDLEAQGIKKDFDILCKEIEERDYNDSHRELAPLKQAEDAVLIDSTDKTLEEVVDNIMDYVKNKG